MNPAQHALQTAAWFNVLEQGFGARTAKIAPGLALTIFRIGPIRVAYANFPAGLRTAEACEAIRATESRRTMQSLHIDLLRYSVPESLAQGTSRMGVIALPETCIHDLPNWTEDHLDGSVRYEIRRARREGTCIRPASPRDAPILARLYRETVLRRGGRPKYTSRYFEALCQLDAPSPGIDVLIAEAPGHPPCGFLVAARDGMETYYLHAAHDHAQTNRRASYALLSAAITQARDEGCDRFNLMVSPAGQQALLRFKEKWGGETRPLLHIDQPISLTGRMVCLGLGIRRRFASLVPGSAHGD